MTGVKAEKNTIVEKIINSLDAPSPDLTYMYR